MKNIHKLSSAGVATALTLAMSSSTVLALGTVTVGTGYADSIGGLISFVLNIVMIIALVLVLLYLIWGGIAWITAGGDKGKTEEARNKITAAVIGIIILAAAWALVQFVAYILGFGSLQEALDGVQTINSGTGADTGAGTGAAGRVRRSP